MLRSPRSLRLAPCGAALQATLLAACALPNDPLSGIEVSWSLTEREASVGEDALALRTCAGALIRRVELTVEDLDDDRRARTFTYACETGYQTASELATLPSNVYVDLREGTYRVTAKALSERGDGEVEVEIDDALELGASGVARLHVDLSPELAPWRLVVSGVEACELAAGRVRYLDPEDDLVDGEAAADDPLYRPLTGDGDPPLVLDGADAPCDGPWSVPQRYLLDPGRYRLEVVRDGIPCEIPFEVPFAGATTTLDLAKLPCDG